MTRMFAFLPVLLLGATAATAQSDWDVDTDGELSPTEFVDGFGSMGTYQAFDTNADASLDAAEWENGLGAVGEYVNMDLNADGGVDEAEYNALLFNRYDGDGSGTIDASEMEQVETDMTAGGMLSR